jgi:stalled ribosome rescue protein Dom34
LPLDELKERAWQLFEPQYLKQLATLADEYNAAHAKGLGSDDAVQVAKAAAAGRVATLLLESNQLDDTDSGENLETLAEEVGKMGGQVKVIPSGSMPSRTGLAASYRY